jgi:hypothetical protein
MSFAVRDGESITEQPAPQTYHSKRYPLVWTADDATTYDVDVVLDARTNRAVITLVQPNGNRPTVSTNNWAPGVEPSLARLQAWASSALELATGKNSAP